MNLKYLRLAVFKSLLAPYSNRTRNRRMRALCRIMGIREGMSVLDLGGQPMIWESVDTPLDITILNLPGIAVQEFESRHRIRYVEGDACNVTEFGERRFDIVFSNSVIEHVGPPDKQAEFAREVRRLGRSYWVQTPCKWFPVEPHCGMPLWWFYPASLRRYFIERWRLKLPGWTEMVEGTRVLTKSDLKRLFPGASIQVEFDAGIPKSYIAYQGRAG